jgi:hypothetical protein
MSPAARRKVRRSRAFQVLTQLGGIRCVNAKLVIRSRDQGKPPVSNELPDRRLSRGVVKLEFRVDQTADSNAMPWRGYRNGRSPQVARLDADEHSVGLHEVSGSLEGMDHARYGHSSK